MAIDISGSMGIGRSHAPVIVGYLNGGSGEAITGIWNEDGGNGGMSVVSANTCIGSANAAAISSSLVPKKHGLKRARRLQYPGRLPECGAGLRNVEVAAARSCGDQPRQARHTREQ